MAKIRVSKQHRKSGSKPVSTLSLESQNSNLISETLLECIQTGDLKSFRSILTSCLTTINKVDLAKKAGIGRQTLYGLIDPKKNFNPELSTVSAIIEALANEGIRSHVK